MTNDREHEPDQTYERLFIRFSEPVEAWLRRIILVLIVLLIVVQGLLQFPTVRKTITRTDPLEGEPLVQKNSETP